MDCINDFLLSRTQYIKNREIIRDDYQESVFLPELPNDLILSPNPTNYIQFYSKGFTGHTGSIGSITPVYPPQSSYSTFIQGIYLKQYSNVNTVCSQNRKLVDPYSIFDTSLIGNFASSFSIPTPHPLTSPEAGAELVELYAMSLLRDVDIRYFQPIKQGPIADIGPPYDIFNSSFVNGILSALNQPNIKNYMGAPLDSSGNITLSNIFRGNTEGDKYGPYISQFLYYNVGMGSCFYRQMYRCYSNQRLEYLYGRKYRPPNSDNNDYPITAPQYYFSPNNSDYGYIYSGSPWIYNNDYSRGLTGFVNTWNGGSNSIISGGTPYAPFSSLNPNDIPQTITPVRYISTLRDGAFYVLRDQIWQPFFTAATILLGCPRYDNTQPESVSRTSFGVPIGFQVDGRVGQKFINLGPVDLFALLSMAGKNSMNACWLWKWTLMYPRPEEMAYQVHIKKKTGLGIDFSSNILNCSILTDVSNCNSGNFVLPQAYINGSPNHPSYPSGHATYAGAMATILKAWFNCDSSMNAYVSDCLRTTTSQGGQITEPIQTQYYADNSNNLLKIEHEIDKLASNTAILRNVGGVHYRQDSNSGLKLGEDVAIKTLENWVQNYYNNIIFRFRLRDGTIYEVSKTYSGPYLGSLPFYANTPVRLTNGTNEINNINVQSANAPFAFINLYGLTDTVFSDPNLF